jgi:serine/threonine-protein kinase
VCPNDGAALTSSVTELVTAPTLPELPAAPPAAGAAVAVATAPAADPMFDSLIGATLAGRYQIVRRIGEGGMGAVYEAKHTLIGKRVAVKVLLEKFLTKSDFVARLLQEARLASSIGHENIVDVTDFGTTDDGRSFVVMEFLDGEALSQLVMREAPLPVERSLRIARQVASALGAAHAKGIFHRDVKPENVYLVQRADADFVKVVDFGISKAVKQGGQDEGPETYRLTHTGLLLGTPLYMSPEQARGDEDVDHRADIWALGVMMYECLTGEVPFRANNYLGIISQVLTHTAVPPSKLRPELGIPDAVEAVVMRAMEKDRSRRYAAMSDLERDLERLIAGDQNVGLPLVEAGAAPRGPIETPRRWPLGLAAAVALGVGVTFALSRPHRPAPPPAVAPAAPAALVTAPPPAPPPVAAAPVGERAAERPSRPSSRSRGHAERRAAAPEAPRAATSTDSVKRGVLPSGSREAYPDQ